MDAPDDERVEQSLRPARRVEDPLTAFDVDELTALAEFETEHRRMLAMQSLYYRRQGRGGVA
jgi:hypothetical protein